MKMISFSNIFLHHLIPALNFLDFFFPFNLKIQDSHQKQSAFLFFLGGKTKHVFLWQFSDSADVKPYPYSKGELGVLQRSYRIPSNKVNSFADHVILLSQCQFILSIYVTGLVFELGGVILILSSTNINNKHEQVLQIVLIKISFQHLYKKQVLWILQVLD